MSHSLKDLEKEVNYVITANNQRRIHLLTILDSYDTELSPDIRALLSSLYARLGNDSFLINKLITELRVLSNKDQQIQSK